MKPTIALSINSCWNIVNFRSGLIRRLQDQGFRVVALAPPDGATATLEAMGVQVLPVAIDSAGSAPHRDAMLALAYWRIMRRLRPVAFLGWTIKPNVYGSLAAHALGIVVINNVSGLGTAFIRRTLLTRIVSVLYRTALRRSRTVFFQNDDDRQLFIAEGLARAGQTRLLPGSGIDLVRFQPADRVVRSGEAESPFTFLLVARLLRDKGVIEYVEAARSVRRNRPDVRFTILGFLDVANRTAISRDQVDDWVAEGVIEYLGAADDVRPIMAAADCVVLPSYREGMPRTLLEAAAMAKPLIATDVPGCREIARAGENALLCRVADATSLAEAMSAMLAMGPDRRATLGQASRRIAEDEFDERIVTDRYLKALADAGICSPGGPTA